MEGVRGDRDLGNQPEPEEVVLQAGPQEVEAREQTGQSPQAEGPRAAEEPPSQGTEKVGVLWQEG